MSFSLKVERGVGDDQEEEDDIKYGPPSARNFAPNYNDLPRVKDEKPYIGPTSSSGNIKIMYPRQIDGYNVDHNELARMDALGLPTGFSFGHMEQVDSRQTRGHKKTYYCSTCMIELNSEDTMVSHMKGVKHMKKQLATDERNRNLGQPVKQAIVPIKNPEPTKKKVPIRLCDKIKESSNPVVGLNYIKEFIAVSDSEMEPHYECSICDSQGQANGMFSHLMGQKHRQEFVIRMYGVGHTTVKLSQAELLKKAHEHNENYDGFTDRIVTRHSDEEYPWPSGKEPWSLLKGGTGIVPDAARKNYGKKLVKSDGQFSNPAIPAKKEGEVQPRPVSQRANARPAPSLVLPLVEHLKPPTNLLDSEKMMELGKSMLLMAAEFPGCGLKHKERALLESCFSALTVKKAGGKNIAASMLPGALTTARRTRSPSSAGSSWSSGNSYRERSPPSRRMRTRSPSFDRRDGRGIGSTTRETIGAARSTRSPSFNGGNSSGGVSSSRYGERSPQSRSIRSPSYAGSCRSGSDSRAGRTPPLGRERYLGVKREPYEEESSGLRKERREGDQGYSMSRMNRMETNDNQARSSYEDARYGREGSRDGSFRDRRNSWSSNDSRASYGDYQNRRGPSPEFEERGSYRPRQGSFRR